MPNLQDSYYGFVRNYCVKGIHKIRLTFLYSWHYLVSLSLSSDSNDGDESYEFMRKRILYLHWHMMWTRPNSERHCILHRARAASAISYVCERRRPLEPQRGFSSSLMWRADAPRKTSYLRCGARVSA